MKQLFACVAAGLFLAACGGGADGPAQPSTVVVSVPPAHPAPPATPSCVPQQVFYILPGDSTQYGIDGSVADDSTWPRAVHNPGAELQAEMDRIFGPGAVVVQDIGVPGTVAADAARPVIPTGSNIGISPNYGLNDARYGYSVTDFMAAMLSMHPTLIETPFPRFDSDPLLPVEQAYIAAEKASGVPIADVNAYVRSLSNWQQYFPLPYSGHATDELYKMVIDNVLAPAVAKQVAPLRCVSL